MSSKTTNLNLTKPSEDEFYDINVQNENMDIIDREINGLKQPAYEVSTAMSDLNSGEMITVAFGKIAKAVSTLISHVANKSNPHGVTKNQIGLGNVPNVATNDQTPTYTEASSLSSLVSGEKTSVAFGKIAKAVSTLISHTTSKATNSVLGHVKLSDSTSSTSASTAGVAATPKAVKAAYDLANSNTEKLGTTDISGIGDGTVTGAIVNNKEAIEDVSQSLTNKNIATVICRPKTTIYDNDSQDLYTEFTCEQNPNDFNLFTAIVSAAYMQTPVYIKEWYSETEDGINISASRTIPVDKHYYNYYYTMITWERNQTAPYKIKVRRAREFFITSTDGVSVHEIGFPGGLFIDALQGIK